MYKDLNDDLKLALDENLQKDHDLTQLLSQGQKEFVKEIFYEESLLHQLGIEKATYLAFKEQIDIKFNKQELLVSFNDDKKVAACWNLSLQDNQLNGNMDVHVHSHRLFMLSGSLQEAKKVILVSSPLEAMIHYREAIQQAVNGKNLKQELATQYMRDNSYVYFKVDDNVISKAVLMNFLQQAQERKKQLVWVAEKDNDPLALLMDEIDRQIVNNRFLM